MANTGEFVPWLQLGERVLELIKNARQAGSVSALEKHLILQKLRELYDSVDTYRTQDLVVDTFHTGRSEFQEPEGEPVLSVPDPTAPESSVIRDSSCTSTGPGSTAPAADLLFEGHIPIDRDIIESLYGDAPRFVEEPEAAPSPSVSTETETNPAPIVPHELPRTVNDEAVSPGKLLNETLAGEPVHDIAAMLSSQSVSELRKSIGINDKFLLLNDLFNNDPQLYERTLDQLDRYTQIEDAYIYLQENLVLDTSKEGVQLLLSLLERKFS